MPDSTATTADMYAAIGWLRDNDDHTGALTRVADMLQAQANKRERIRHETEVALLIAEQIGLDVNDPKVRHAARKAVRQAKPARLSPPHATITACSAEPTQSAALQRS